MAQAPQKTLESEKSSQQLGAFFFMAGIFVIIFTIMILFGDVLYPFIIGLFIAYLLCPFMNWCAAKLKSRTIAAILIVTSLMFFLFLGVVKVFPFFKQQTLYLLQRIPYYIQAVHHSFLVSLQQLKILFPDMITAENPTQFSEHFFSASQWSRIAMKKVISGGSLMVNTFVFLVILPLVIFFLIRDGQKCAGIMEGLIPKRFVHSVLEQARLMDAAISGFIRGQAIIALILGSFYSIGLSLLGLDFALVIGIGTGILSFLPYVGTMIGLSVSLLVGFYQFESLKTFLCVPGVFALAQVWDMFFLTPHFVGKRVNLHSLWMLFSLFVGGSLYGFVGAFMAIPVTAILGILGRFGMKAYQGNVFYLKE
jgi:predicted PurR-regulated permease PerM